MTYLSATGLVLCAHIAAFGASAVAGRSALAAEEPANAGTPFSQEWLWSEAERLSRAPYVKQTLKDLGSLGELSYDQYREIRFEKGASIWAREGRGFTIEPFHPGFIYKTPTEIDLVASGRARTVRFNPEVFDYGPSVERPARVDSLAYSGFRVRYAINRPDTMDEFLLFQGASYFRAIGRGQIYGLSARGLAVKTGDAEGEEFPAFTRFWIERPPVGAKKLVIHALLDSPSIAGAYSFTVVPGDDTQMTVHAVLFPRAELRSFGIAPLTSMFLFDATNHMRFDDFRAAVHDSNGLQMVTGAGERLWRPLANPRELQISSFVDSDPKGFGLVQRARRYEAYLDNEARYDLRPSVWVEPAEAWGPGFVELVEIPSAKETHDNMVAFWRSASPLESGRRYDFNYRLHWLATPRDDVVRARVAATRLGRALEGDRRQFVVDYDYTDAMPPDLEPAASASAGELSNVRGEPVAATRQYRVTFELDPRGEDVIELRLVLSGGGKPWSETWLYRWTQ